jgi:hypothetical protein
MWDGVKSLGSRKRTNFIIKKHAMKGNGAEGKTFQREKNPKNFKAWVLNPNVILLRRGSFEREPTQRGCYREAQRRLFQLQ